MRGRTTPASGASTNPYKKSDAVSKIFRIECKLTEKQSYSVSRSVLDKIEREALRNCQSPLLHLQIDGEQFAVVRWSDFQQLCHDAKYV